MKYLAVLLLGLAAILPASAADELRFNLAPNPASTVVTITPETNFNIKKIELFSVIGNLVYSQDVVGNVYQEPVQVNISRIPDGIYLVRVSGPNSSTVKRLKIQHI